MILLLFVAFTSAFVGFLWGRVMEWKATLDYLHKYEDREVWWVAAGIAADCHRRRCKSEEVDYE